MYEVEFLPIEKTGEGGSRSGDAILIRFGEEATATVRTVVIDGGFGHTGDQLVRHIRRWYPTLSSIDLVISTHPDQDHINGLGSVLEEFTVGELFIHIPHEHTPDAATFNNIAVVDALIGLAEEKGTMVTEPFTGLERFGGQLRVLGPTVDYYETLLEEHLREVATGENGARLAAASRPGWFTKSVDLLERALLHLPFETLAEDGQTSPRNNSSVVTLLTVGGERMLFTGDAGIPALHAAWDEFEARVGPSASAPLGFIQAPHHGSKRNVSPSLLNRILGEPHSGSKRELTAFVSSARADPKHPSPKVTNALQRRGAAVFATEGGTKLHMDGVAMRPGYAPAPAIEALEEDDD